MATGPLSPSRRSPDRASRALVSIITLGSVNVIWVAFSSSSPGWSAFSSAWQPRRGAGPSTCRLRDGWRFSLGVCCRSLGAPACANERCAFKKLTSQLIKVGADGGGKVNCACSRASAGRALPNSPPRDTGLFWSSAIESRLPARDCRPDKKHADLQTLKSTYRTRRGLCFLCCRTCFVFGLWMFCSSLIVASSCIDLEHIPPQEQVPVFSTEAGSVQRQAW